MKIIGLNSVAYSLIEIQSKLKLVIGETTKKWGKVLNLSRIEMHLDNGMLSIKIEFKSFSDKKSPMHTCNVFNKSTLNNLLEYLRDDFILLLEYLIFSAWFSNCATPEEFIHNATLHAVVVNKTSIELKKA